MLEPNAPNYIDLFAGCGGLSLGLHQSGWKGLFAIEKSPFAFSTLKYNLIDKLNHFDWPLWLSKQQHDINEILSTKDTELKSLRGTVDLVAGGPPCQGFSTAGRRVESDSRNKLIKSYIDFIRLVQPKIIFFENVRGFTQRFEKNKTKGKLYSEYVKNCLMSSSKDYIGYEVYGQLINFYDYGVPQKRTRFILIGIRKDHYNVVKIKPETVFNSLENNSFDFLKTLSLNKNNSLKDAISDLLESNGTIDTPDSANFKSGVYCDAKTSFQKYLRGTIGIGEIPDSHRLAKHGCKTKELFKSLISTAPIGKKICESDRQKYSIKKRSLLVLDGLKPAPTITSHPDDYVHFSEPRILTVRECARIQTFPDWYKFREKYTTGGQMRKVEVPRYTQVGNAIPPLFGQQVGHVLKHLLDGKY